MVTVTMDDSTYTDSDLGFRRRYGMGKTCSHSELDRACPHIWFEVRNYCARVVRHNSPHSSGSLRCENIRLSYRVLVTRVGAI